MHQTCDESRVKNQIWSRKFRIYKRMKKGMAIGRPYHTWRLMRGNRTYATADTFAGILNAFKHHLKKFRKDNLYE